MGAEEYQLLRQKKQKEYEKMIGEQLPPTRRAYRIFETDEERLIRLELKYLNKVIASRTSTPFPQQE